MIGRGSADVESGLPGFGKACGTQRSPRRRKPVRARAQCRDRRGAAGGRGAAALAGQCGFQPWTISERTRPASRKRTSAFAGCTLTSTSRARNVHEQRQHRMPVARQIIGIGRAHRAQQEFVAHRPAVDEQILAERIGAAEASATRQSRRSPLLRRVRPTPRTALARKSAPRMSPSRVRRPVGARQRRGKRNRRALLAGERERDIRPAHREAAHHVAHRFGLGAVELEKLEPRRRRIKQIAHLDAGALAERGGPERRTSRRHRLRSTRRAARRGGAS